MEHTCDKCNITFSNSKGLKQHHKRKTPCTPVLEIQPPDDKNMCKSCKRVFSTTGNLTRHLKGRCRANVTQPSTSIIVNSKPKSIQSLNEQIIELQKLVKELSGIKETNSLKIDTVNNTSNSATIIIEKVEIRPWGTPLEISAKDIASALSKIPTLAGNLAINDIVELLVELTKRAHVSPESRNIHLNPKRSDQALALMENGWAAVPLKDATRILFDGAAGCIANQLKPNIPGMMPANIAATLPQQYRNDRENCVSLGMKPMVAHLTNVAPGGPGPCLQIENAAQAGAAGAAVQQQPVQVDIHTAAALVRPLKSANEITAAWLEQQAKNTNLTVPAIVNAIWRAGSAGLCGVLESRTAQEILRDNPYLRML